MVSEYNIVLRKAFLTTEILAITVKCDLTCNHRMLRLKSIKFHLVIFQVSSGLS
jgi:hypothetical protein